MTGDERRVAERRTMALRGPGAGGFTPPQSLAASNPCLNCGTNIQLTYCPECGQPEIDSDPTLRDFAHELAEEFLHWDGKLFRTFRLLVTRPGELTREYLAGRRVRYISPLRVYLTCSVLFFFLEALAPSQVVVTRDGRRVEAGFVQVGQSTEAQRAAIVAEGRSGNALKRVWMTHLANALRTPNELKHATTSAIPKAMFVLVPLFAALIGMAYRDRRRKYPQHLAFALHVHAALFLTLTLMLAGRFFASPVASAVVQLLVLLPFAVYLVRATRRVYDSSTGQTLARLTLVSVLHFIAFVGVLAATFAIVVLSS